ncbi:MarR family transcriptional regulator [Halobacillus salinarum]|uniref:MarR family transcriptional regulator n=1 Tax=Halobacillus salinarum TaxID=2932257 RepID=A0ABY4EKB1_9BACI|nr:MarR family transcriptional regulator [Halobacillus salinarum]UOQ44518.1 MarR family transcriptional regulator [Halobacillus salinarum]
MLENDTKSLIAELELSMRSFIRDYRKELNEVLGDGFTSSEFSFLRAIHENNCQNVTRLATLLNVSNSHATSVMDRLEAKGLLTRTRSEKDRRVVVFMLTEEGEKIFNSLDKRREAYMEERFNKLSHEEIKELIRIFKSL